MNSTSSIPDRWIVAGFATVCTVATLAMVHHLVRSPLPSDAPFANLTFHAFLAAAGGALLLAIATGLLWERLSTTSRWLGLSPAAVLAILIALIIVALAIILWSLNQMAEEREKSKRPSRTGYPPRPDLDSAGTLYDMSSTSYDSYDTSSTSYDTSSMDEATSPSEETPSQLTQRPFERPGQNYERKDFFDNPYIEHEGGERTYQRTDFFGEQYHEVGGGDRAYERTDFFGDRYIENTDGTRSYYREDFFGNQYIENPDGSRTYKREDFFGNTYWERDD